MYQIGGIVEFPLQIVVTRELQDDDFLAFRIMKRDAEEKDIVDFLELTDTYENPGDREDASAVLFVTNEINYNLEGESDMKYSILNEVFKDEIEKKIAVATEESEKRGEKRGRKKEMESLQRKAKKLEKSGLGADQILKELGLV